MTPNVIQLTRRPTTATPTNTPHDLATMAAHQEAENALAMALHFGRSEVGELLHQERPVAGDGIARVVAELVHRLDRKTARPQRAEHQVVGGGGKAVGVGKNDQRGLAVGHRGQISLSFGVVIFLSARRLLPAMRGTWVWLPSQVGSSMLSNTSRSFWPQVSCSMRK